MIGTILENKVFEPAAGGQISLYCYQI